VLTCRSLVVLASLTFVLALTGCGLFGGGGSNSFTIEATGYYTPANCPSPNGPNSCGTYTFPMNASVYGNQAPGFGGSPTGSNGFYSGNTSLTSTNPVAGLYVVQDPIVPSYWDHNAWLPMYCQNVALNAYSLGTQAGNTDWESDLNVMENGSYFPWMCGTNLVPPSGQSYSPQFAIVGAVPSSATVPVITQSNPFISTYGPPELEIYTGANGTPSHYSTLAASSVDPSGDAATFALPSMPQGAYSLVTSNKNADSTFTTNAYRILTIAGSQTIAGNPFGVAAGGLAINTSTCTTIIIGGHPHQSCHAASSYTALPVVSLYSQAQVLIGSTAVSVGANPTAVAAYAGGQVIEPPRTVGNETIYTTVTGANRAVVTNSGSNTVSVLDLVNDVLLTNITVGNQPVALVVSTDGTMGYVANYADSTVTQVNLTADTPITTIAVGGQPTSVALTAAGVLWMGGAGFLTEINTSNMSVTATESTSGRTIAGLGFSDAENELIATSTVGTGNVSIDEINPSSVQTGSTYAAVASHSVSTLGTYYNPRIQAQSFGFTSTLTSSTIPINTAQVGAPPLVVQDGWAVVTATPTGFSITDASGHVVLVSETTPSPIAAIAVDTNLNVAYLTMPDSNTLLTVPLPGTAGN